MEYVKEYWGITEHYKNGVLHRDGDLPAVISARGDLEYWKNGKRHRDNGPAVIRKNGVCSWYKKRSTFSNVLVGKMEVIADELQKNDVHIDIETLSEHVLYILDNYRDTYSKGVNALNRFPLNVYMFQKVFKEINVDSVGRAMAYLTLVYRTNHLTDEETVRQAVRLVVPVLRNAGRVESGFIRNLCSWGVQATLNLWELM